MTDLLKPLEVLFEKSHGSFRPVSAQLHNAVLQQLLDVVLLHIALTLPQAPLFFTARTAGRHADLLTRHMHFMKPNGSGANPVLLHKPKTSSDQLFALKCKDLTVIMPFKV